MIQREKDDFMARGVASQNCEAINLMCLWEGKGRNEDLAHDPSLAFYIIRWICSVAAGTIRLQERGTSCGTDMGRVRGLFPQGHQRPRKKRFYRSNAQRLSHTLSLPLIRKTENVQNWVTASEDETGKKLKLRGKHPRRRSMFHHSYVFLTDTWHEMCATEVERLFTSVHGQNGGKFCDHNKWRWEKREKKKKKHNKISIPFETQSR